MKISALLAVAVPPAMTTEPSGSSVVVWPERARAREPAGEKGWVTVTVIDLMAESPAALVTVSVKVLVEVRAPVEMGAPETAVPVICKEPAAMPAWLPAPAVKTGVSEVVWP